MRFLRAIAFGVRRSGYFFWGSSRWREALADLALTPGQRAGLKLKALFSGLVGLFPFALSYLLGWTGSLRRERGSGRPVILIHGVFGHEWNWFWMRRALKKRGLGPLYSLTLSPTNGSIDEYGEQVGELATRVAREQGRSDVALVGYSMGGVVAAYYAERIAPAGTVREVVTLCSPMRGSEPTGFTPTSAGLFQLVEGAPFIEDLWHRVGANSGIRYFHIGSRLDGIVWPWSTTLVGSDPQRHLLLQAHSHVAVLFSPTVAEQIAHWMQT